MEKAAITVRTQTQKMLEGVSNIGWLTSPLLFWRQSLKQPVQICSLFPSRPSVGKKLFEAVRPFKNRPIIELGAGTGAVTRQLLSGGVDPQKLSVVELDPEFTTYLERHFPRVEVLTMRAEDISGYWRNKGGDEVGAVVSTLPIKLFDAGQQLEILSSMFDIMEDGAPFVQLTYRLSPPIEQSVVDELGLRARRIEVVWRSIPPAFLWKYERR